MAFLGALFGGGGGSAAGAAAGAGEAAGGFSAGVGSSGLLGSSAFGGEGLSSALGTTGTFAQPLSFAEQLSNFASNVGGFAMDTVNPGGGQAYGNIQTALKAGNSPAFGDLVQYLSQSLINGQLQRGAGPAFDPLRGLVANQQAQRQPFQLRLAEAAPLPGKQRQTD